MGCLSQVGDHPVAVKGLGPVWLHFSPANSVDCFHGMLLRRGHILHTRSCRHLVAVRATQQAAAQAGLYSIPGLLSPGCWEPLTRDAHDACIQQVQVVLDDTGINQQEWAAACAEAVFKSMHHLDSILLPAQHCCMHHPNPSWQQAAAAALAFAQQQDSALQHLLRDVSQHPAFDGAPLGAIATGVISSSSAHTREPESLPNSNLAEESSAADEALSSEVQQARQHLTQLIKVLEGTADAVLLGDGHLIVFDTQADTWLLGEELTAALPRWAGGTHSTQRPEMTHEGGSKDVLVLSKQHHHILTQLMAERWWQDQAAAPDASTHKQTAKPPRLSVVPCGPQQQIQLPDNLGCVEMSAPVWLSSAALGVISDAVDGQATTSASSQLCVMPLTLAGCLQLLSQHTQPLLRQLVFDVGVAPRLRAFAEVLDALRRVRHMLAQLEGHTSWTHRALSTSLAGGPDAVMSVLQDMATAWKSPAVEQVKQLHSSLTASQDADTAAADGVQPWDYDFHMQACEVKLQGLWPRVRDCFPLHHLVSEGLSGVLLAAGLQLCADTLQPGELWQYRAPGSQQPEPIKVVLHDTAGSLGRPLGIVYVIPDPHCQMPYTMLVRPQAPAAAGWQHAGQQGLCRVAVHLPADNLVTGSAWSDPHWCLAEPHMLRVVLHEMGHALSYLISCQGRASSRMCVAYAPVEVAELASHLLERCAGDAGSLLRMSARRGRQVMLSVGDARALALLTSSPHRSWSPLEVQQHVLLAMSDVLMHSEEAQDYSCIDVMNHVWDRYGPTQQIIPTGRLLSLMPGLIHLSGGRLAAYPHAELLAAAVWQTLNLAAPVATQLAASRADDGAHYGWMAVRKHVFGADAYSTLDQVVTAVLGPESFRSVDGGRVLDLAADVFQDLEL